MASIHKGKTVVYNLFLFLLLTALLIGCSGVSEATTVTPIPTATPTIAPAAPAVFDVDNIDMESTPQSSCFSSVGYDSDFQVLAVVFRTTGKMYVYYDFPESEWDNFINADSLGKYYNANIKGKYD